MIEKLQLTIWGSRGTFVQTSNDKIKYGLETTCLTLESENQIIIIDCGSGIREFSKYLYNNNLVNKKIKIFITHYHYDHIFGLPFSKFILDKDIDVEIFGPSIRGKNVEQILEKFYSPPYFPLNIVKASDFNFKEVLENKKYTLADIEVEAISLNHGISCMGYRFITNNKKIAIITDYEYKTDKNKEAVEKFIDGSDVLVIDSFFQEKDYKEGWGHSTIEENIEIVKKCNIKNAYLTHHNTNYTDDYMDEIEKEIKTTNSNICFAKDRMVIDI